MTTQTIRNLPVTTATTTATPGIGGTTNQQQRNVINFSPKKCWICLEIFQLDDPDCKLIQKYFCLSSSSSVPANLDELGANATSRNNRLLLSSNLSGNKLIKKIRLVIINNKIVLTVCKCRKKLAHLNCFNNYIDLKQKGNINIDIYCSQCNYKYEFDYPYNGNTHSHFFGLLFHFIKKTFNEILNLS